MTKKEEKAVRDELAQAVQQLALDRAMRLHPPVARDLPPPTMYSMDGVSMGWDFCGGLDDGRVEKAHSTSTSHYFGSWTESRYNSQNPCHLFSTRKLALMAMRSKLGYRFAKILAAIEKEIAEADEVPKAAEGTKEPK